MKKSEQLRQEAQAEENDFKAMGIYRKVLREERLERFENYIDVLLERGFNLTFYEQQGKTTIETDSKFGIIDYYPKANKVLIRKQNKWITGGLKWIINNLIK